MGNMPAEKKKNTFIVQHLQQNSFLTYSITAKIEALNKAKSIEANLMITQLPFHKLKAIHEFVLHKGHPLLAICPQTSLESRDQADHTALSWGLRIALYN